MIFNKWKYSYGETDEHVLFGDWQISFQTYADLYRILPDDRRIKRAQKFSIVLERLISPEGTFPVFGRSIPYRMATMQPLALMAWYQKLTNGLTNGQVRAALTSVMHSMFDGKDNFNEKGVLTIGFAGRQPNVADWYTNNGFSKDHHWSDGYATPDLF